MFSRRSTTAVLTVGAAWLGLCQSVCGAPAPQDAPLTAQQMIEVLDQTVDWYRSLATQQQAADEPSDLLFFNENRQSAGKVVALAFELARADADLLAREAPATAAVGDSGLSAPGLVQIHHKLDTRTAALHAELDAQRHLLQTAGGRAKIEAQAKIRELGGELDLLDTKRTILDTLTEVATGADGTSLGSLKAQIDAMSAAVTGSTPSPATPAAGAAPAAAATAPAQPTPTAPLLASANLRAAADRFGLWDLGADALRLSAKSATLIAIDRRTADLETTLQGIRLPLVAGIKALSARGDALAAQAESADSATLNGMRDELDALAQQFKRVSSLLVPLSRETLLLGQYRRNLANWHESIQVRYRAALRTLAVRLALVLALLALLFGAAALWRSMVLRYVQDARRRHQLLLLRRIALWSLVVIVVGLAFASELGSIVTFAGLITAGIAVAMQSVLVSIVGYFFLIGKYGIRVGDRVQIGDVTGEVIDLGLVRMYLMELGAKGATGPTGRVVAFANSIAFQVSSGLFRQLPGVNLAWREVVLNLPPVADYAAVKERLLAALEDALKDHREEILRQSREIERTTRSTSAGDVEPKVQLRFSTAGVEAHVRYPVHVQHAAEIDERVTESLAAVLSALPNAPAPHVDARSG